MCWRTGIIYRGTEYASLLAHCKPIIFPLRPIHPSTHPIVATLARLCYCSRILFPCAKKHRHLAYKAGGQSFVWMVWKHELIALEPKSSESRRNAFISQILLRWHLQRSCDGTLCSWCVLLFIRALRRKKTQKTKRLTALHSRCSVITPTTCNCVPTVNVALPCRHVRTGETQSGCDLAFRLVEPGNFQGS